MLQFRHLLKIPHCNIAKLLPQLHDHQKFLVALLMTLTFSPLSSKIFANLLPMLLVAPIIQGNASLINARKDGKKTS